MHFGGLEDYRQDSTALHITLMPQLGDHRHCGLAISTFHLGFSLAWARSYWEMVVCRPNARGAASLPLVIPEAVVSGFQHFVDINFEGSLVMGMFYLHDIDRHLPHLLDGFRQEPFSLGGGVECPGQLQTERAFNPMVSDSECFLGEDMGEGCGSSWLAPAAVMALCPLILCTRPSVLPTYRAVQRK